MKITVEDLKNPSYKFELYTSSKCHKCPSIKEKLLSINNNITIFIDEVPKDFSVKVVPLMIIRGLDDSIVGTVNHLEVSTLAMKIASMEGVKN
jgi:hypothetical protein